MSNNAAILVDDYIQHNLHNLQSPARTFKQVLKRPSRDVCILHTGSIQILTDKQVKVKPPHTSSTCRLKPFIAFAIFILLLETSLNILTSHRPSLLQFEKALSNSVVDEAVGRIGDACCALVFGEETCKSLSVCEAFFGTQLCGEGGLCFSVLRQNGCIRLF